ncbi:MAG: acyl-CoA thioesterase [Solirubrobacteraceae bacterium]
MQPRSPSESTSVLAHWMGMADANSSRHVHGGTIMKLVDEAAGVASMRHSRCRVVTASIDRMSFLVPIEVGELVTFTATVNAAWRTSMEVGVRVVAERARSGELRHASTAYLTMVAVDDAGRPLPVPPLQAATPDEERRVREAELRRSHRLAEREAIERGRRTMTAGSGTAEPPPAAPSPTTTD